MIKSVIWPQKDKDKAIKMVGEGYTAIEIAAVLKRTKNSIIGFIHRSGLRFSSTNPTHRAKIKNAACKRSKLAPKPELPIENNNIRFFEARLFQCRFILDSPKNVWDTICCGAPVYKQSYCQAHYRICYRKFDIKPRTQTNAQETKTY